MDDTAAVAAGLPHPLDQNFLFFFLAPARSMMAEIFRTREYTQDRAVTASRMYQITLASV